MNKLIPPCPVCGRNQAGASIHIPFSDLNLYWRSVGVALEQDYPEFKYGITRLDCRHCQTGFFTPSTAGKPSLYDALSSHSWYYDSARWEHSRILTILEREKVRRCLEVGCGDGGFLLQISKICPEASGIETNPRGYDECLRKGLNVSTSTLDTFPAQNLDAIVLVQVLEHIENTSDFLSQAKRCLAPGGLLIVSVPNEDGILGRQSRNYLNLPPHHVTLWRKASFGQVATRYDLTLELHETQDLPFPQFLSYYDEITAAALNFHGVAGQLARKLGFVFSRILAPLAFETSRHKHAGHTQLAVFRNPHR